MRRALCRIGLLVAVLTVVCCAWRRREHGPIGDADLRWSPGAVVPGNAYVPWMAAQERLKRSLPKVSDLGKQLDAAWERPACGDAAWVELLAAEHAAALDDVRRACAGDHWRATEPASSVRLPSLGVDRVLIRLDLLRARHTLDGGERLLEVARAHARLGRQRILGGSGPIGMLLGQEQRDEALRELLRATAAHSLTPSEFEDLALEVRGLRTQDAEAAECVRFEYTWLASYLEDPQQRGKLGQMTGMQAFSAPVLEALAFDPGATRREAARRYRALLESYRTGSAPPPAPSPAPGLLDFLGGNALGEALLAVAWPRRTPWHDNDVVDSVHAELLRRAREGSPLPR